MFYTVGEMAKILNTTPSTLRYYDKEGLLPFVASACLRTATMNGCLLSIV